MYLFNLTNLREITRQLSVTSPAITHPARLKHLNQLTMPGQHVHFAEGAYPPTPSSTYSSSSSLPSSDEPVTPPPLNYYGSPHAYSPLPSVGCRIHPALSVSTYAVNIFYDVSFPPNTAQLHPSISSQIFSQPATNPPLPYMTIIHRQLPWTIRVVPTRKPGTYVTVGDVLEAIYHRLRLTATEMEYRNIPTQDMKERVDMAYRRRYKRLQQDGGEYEKEKARGVRRIDFIGEKNIFAGLGSTGKGPDVWELQVQVQVRVRVQG